jgi:hypothetical protein
MTKPKQNTDLKERQRIYYSAIVNAYIESSMERDRSLLNLSAGAIGLLVTLMTAVGVSSTFELVLYAAATICFAVNIVLILHVFRLNKTYLLNLANDEPTDDIKLKKFDSSIFAAFLTGVVLLFSIGVSATLSQLNQKENHPMSGEKKESKKIIESFDDLSKLQPDSTHGKKSLQDLAKLKPKPESGGKTGETSSDSGKTKE